MLCVLQAAAFLQYFLVSVFEPAFGYVLVALLAEVMRRRLTYMLESRRAGKLTAWQDVEAPAQAITYWSLQVSVPSPAVSSAQLETFSPRMAQSHRQWQTNALERLMESTRSMVPQAVCKAPCPPPASKALNTFAGP